MVIALAFFKRIFTRSLPMNQAHGLIIAEVCGTCRVSTKTTFAAKGSPEGDASSSGGLASYCGLPRADLRQPRTGLLRPQRHDLQEVL